MKTAESIETVETQAEMFDQIKQKSNEAMEKAKVALRREGSSTTDDGDGVQQSTTQESDGSSSRLEELSEMCPQLTFQQRLMGFTICFGFGCTSYVV